MTAQEDTLPARETGTAADPVLAEYRHWLLIAEQKAQEDYDKTAIALSGGALAISFAFVKDIIGPGEVLRTGLLVGAWSFWALSSAAVLMSHFVSRLALRKAIEQCDDESIRNCKTPGSIYTRVLRWLNVFSGSFFLFGVFLMAFFVYVNVTTRENIHERQKATAAASYPSEHSVAETNQGRRQANQGLRAATDQAKIVCSKGGCEATLTAAPARPLLR